MAASSALYSPEENQERAASAGLRYVNDAEPGIRRIKDGSGFRYEHPDGRRVKDDATMERIEGLAVPPAWTEVWICKDANGHLQATGRDAKGRKQYRYHSDWRKVREADKFDRLIEFGEALPRVREQVEEDLARSGLPRGKVVAAIVRLLETTYFRVGNEQYARENGSHGLTTLRDEHVKIRGGRIRFRFRGKSGKKRELDLRDKRLARVVKRCRDLPGQELFQYEGDHGDQGIACSHHVNEYLKEATGKDFTAKDFRTWAGTLLAYEALCDVEPADTKTARKRQEVDAVKAAAEALGNTPAVCRRSYVHPAVLEAFLEGELSSPEQRRQADGPHALSAEEETLLRVLKRARRAKREKGTKARRRPKPRSRRT